MTREEIIQQLAEKHQQYEETKRMLINTVTVNGFPMMFSSRSELEEHLDNYKQMVLSNYDINPERIAAMEECGNEPVLQIISDEILKLEEELNARN